MIQDLLKKATAIPLFVKFPSVLKDGFYDYNFTETLDLIRIKPNSGIYLDGISFSASCKIWDFSSAATDGIGVQFSTRSGREPVMLRQMKFYSFSDHMTLNAIVTGKKPANLNQNANRQDDYLTVSINGRIKQTEALIKENKYTVDVLLAIVAYEITDVDILNRMTRNFSEVDSKPVQQFISKPKPAPVYSAPVNTVDMAPPSHFKNVRAWSKGNAVIEAWES